MRLKSCHTESVAPDITDNEYLGSAEDVVHPPGPHTSWTYKAHSIK